MKKPFWRQRIRDWGIVQKVIKPVALAIGTTAGGDNKLGESVHGFLDLLPVPNQPIGKLIKAVLAGNWDGAKVEIGKLLTLRNMISLGLTVAITLGWITYEDVKNFFNLFGKVTELMNGLGIEG